MDVRGYAVIAIDYRLDPNLNGPHTEADQLPPQPTPSPTPRSRCGGSGPTPPPTASTPPGSRRRATRPAAPSPSASSAAPDSHPATSPYAAYSPSVAAAVSTGAYLTPGLEAGVLHLTGHEAPILMFHYETDVASAPGPYAYETCTDYRRGRHL